jgi:hypothetical protein
VIAAAMDVRQKKRAILRNHPVIAFVRNSFERIRHELSHWRRPVATEATKLQQKF